MYRRDRFPHGFNEERTTDTGELDQLTDNNWALIFNNDGNPIGMFIPEGYTEEDAPISLVAIVRAFNTEQEPHHATVKNQQISTYH